MDFSRFKNTKLLNKHCPERIISNGTASSYIQNAHKDTIQDKVTLLYFPSHSESITMNK